MACVTWCNYDGDIPPKNDGDPNSGVIEWEIDLSTFSDWFRNEVLGVFRGETPVVPSRLYVAAHSTACSSATPGTELSDDGYGRFAVTFERVSDIKIWNPVLVSSPTSAAEWTILSVSIWDSAAIGAGNYYAYGNLSEALTLTTGKSLAIEANKLIIGMGSAP
jgi:hypothetical protein